MPARCRPAARAYLAGIVGFVAVVALAGCAAGTPDTTRYDTVSAKVGARPSFPDVAWQRTDAGAIAFATYYYSTFNYGMATFDVGPLVAASDPANPYTQRLVATVQAITQQGLTYRGGQVSVSFGKVRQRPAADVVVVDLVINQSAGTVTGTDGTPQPANAAVTAGIREVKLAWRGAKWVVLDVTPLERR